MAVLILLEFQFYLKQIVIDNCCLYRQVQIRLTYKELQVKILGSLQPLPSQYTGVLGAGQLGEGSMSAF